MVKICVITIMIGNLSYKDKAKENHKKYCDKHGYAYVCIEHCINEFHPMWMKPDVILSELNKEVYETDGLFMTSPKSSAYDYVFWMDGDSFFVNMDIKIELLTSSDANFIASGDENDIVNTGHLLFKNSKWSVEFIQKWIRFRQPLTFINLTKFKQVTTHFTDQYLADQPPINLILGGADENKQDDWFDIFNTVNLYSGNTHKKYGKDYSPTCDENLERTNSLICKDMKSCVKILNQNRMNSYPATYKKDDFILHFVTDKWRFDQILQSIL